MFASFIAGVRARIAPFVDPTVLLLLAVGFCVMWLIDPVLVKTLLQWALPWFAFVAFVVIVSWLVFPHILFSEWIEEARKGNVVAGYIFLALALFMGLAMISLSLYVKAA